jgi:ribonuclease HI
MKTYWVDGGYANDRGYGSYCDDEGNVTRFMLPDAETNNEAEYGALIKLLATLPLDLKEMGPTIHTDSRLLVGQLTLGWKCKAKNLTELLWVATTFYQRSNSHLQWVPRIEILKRLGH